MTALRLLLAAAAPWALWGAAAPEGPLPPQAQDETVYIDEVKKDFLDKIQRCEEAKEWKSLFEHYAYGLRKYAQKVVSLDASPKPRRYTSVSEFLTQRLSRLPKEAYDFYRLENDGKAKAAFDRARDEGSRRDLERAVEDFFFSSYTDEVLDQLANQAFDEGRVEEALFNWGRLLRSYPDSDIPRAVTAVRIAHACRVAENDAALQDLRQFVEQQKIDGKVQVGGRAQPLAAVLAAIEVPVRAAVVRPLKVPYALSPEDRERRRVLGVRNDIKRWTYDFAADRGEPQAQAQPDPNQVLRRRAIMMRGEVAAPQFGEFPFFPAYAKVRGREFVLLTDGSRLVAVDPAKVKGTSTTTGVYWKYPDRAILRPNPNNNPGVFLAVNRPYIGVTVDGEHAYVTMFSDLKVRPREANPNAVDFFEGTTAMKCFHIPSGKLVWDTDMTPLLDDMKAVCKDFFDRNFSFSAPPLVKGDRLYVGICTSPVGEQESRVLCLDKKTGKPLWCTFLASVNGARGTAWGWSAGRLVVYQTLLAEDGGAIYAQTSLGVVAALNSVTGNILWLSKYDRAGLRPQQSGMIEPALIRPANRPVLWKGHVFALPQDKNDLLAFDKISGKPLDLAPPRTREGDLDWKNMTHLLGVVDDWMVVGGTTSHVIKLKEFLSPAPVAPGDFPRSNAYSLASSNTAKAGRGVVDGDLVYLSASGPPGGNPTGVLGVYDVRTWKSLDQPAWKDQGEHGNLLVAGNYLVVAAQKILIYTDVETIRNEYVRKLNQSPPHADALLEFGDVMKENDRLEEAAEAYLGFIKAAEGDPRHEVRVRQVKGELHGIFLRRGDEAARQGDQVRALELYTFAKGFAYDEKTEADTTQKLAETYEKLERWKDAVGQWQRLVEKGRSLYHRESEDVMKLWQHARKQIDEIVKKAPQAYEDVEKRAAEALKKAQEGGAEALRDVMDRFPNSKTAKEAWQKLRDGLLKEGKFDKLRALYNDLKDRFKLDLNFDAFKELLELLEKFGDQPRLRFELGRFAERFPHETIATDAGEEAVKDYVQRRLRELAPGPRPDEPVLQAPLKRVGELEAPKPSDPRAAAARPFPLRPRGVEPPDFARHHELFVRGSAVELWDLKEKRRVWTRAHPGGYLGAAFTDPPAGSSGAAVTETREGSPAQRAGLKAGDVIRSVDGRAVSAATLTDALAEIEPGKEVELALVTEGAPARKRVTLDPYPAEARPWVVGASFTSDYALAVAWEDMAASVDLATGRLQWSFRSVRDRFHVRAFYSTDGRLYLYEANRSDRDRDPLRSHSPQAVQERQAFRPEEAHHRLLCLSDFTGELVWARAFDFDPANPAQVPQVSFFGKYLADSVTVLLENNRGGTRDWVLWVLMARDASGKDTSTPWLHRTLPGTLQAHAVDEEAGVLYYVADLTSDRRERFLYSLSIDPARKDFKPVEVALHPQKYMPAPYGHCALAVDRDLVVLLVAPHQAGADHRLWVFKDGKEFRSLSLREGRTLPPARAPTAAFDREGTLYVYNVPRDKGGALGTGRAFLTAIRVAAPAGAEPEAWDAVAPVVGTGVGTVCSVRPEPENLVLFTASRAAAPGQSVEGALGVLYDKRAEGYLHMVHTDLLPAAEGTEPAAAWRGRIYVSGRQSLQVFGD
jgi:outer membrane protein assembly factor BamB/tetratricopeptide (TPR) repeat protein